MAKNRRIIVGVATCAVVLAGGSVAANSAFTAKAPQGPVHPSAAAKSPAAPAATSPQSAVRSLPRAVMSDADFYSYRGPAPLSKQAPGTVLRTRSFSYPVTGSPLPITIVQLLFRTNDAQNRPIAAATSVLLPPGPRQNGLISYQSIYDSMNPKDAPSYFFRGETAEPLNPAESANYLPLLLRGYAVNIADIEGPSAHFAAGPEYGHVTLDSIRAAMSSAATGAHKNTPTALLGYSGGSIATNWAAALAPKYAPDVNRRLVGTAGGGLLVDPAHNLKYIDGSAGWAGVAAMALIGTSRAYGIDFRPYLSAYGEQIWAQLQKAPITDVEWHYPGLTWAQLMRPQYSTPESVAPFVRVANLLNLGSAPTPTTPMFLGQGAIGTTEGSVDTKPGIGPGDGVMIAGDVRSLARRYCAAGIPVTYTQYNQLSHVPAMIPWAAAAQQWLVDRFAAKPAPSSCGSIAPGNSLAPMRGAKAPSSAPSQDGLLAPLQNGPLAPVAPLLGKPLQPGLRPDAALGSLGALL